MHHLSIAQRGDMEMKENKFGLINGEHYSFFFFFLPSKKLV